MGLSNTGNAAATGVTAAITLPAGLTFAPPALPAGSGGAAVYPQGRLASYMRFALDGLFSAGDWNCTLSGDALTATCELPALGAGDASSLDLNLRVSATDLPADAETSFSVTSGTQTVTYKVLTGLQKAGQGQGVDDTYSAEGHMAAIHVGATLLGCDQTNPACESVMNFVGTSEDSKYNNNNWMMKPLNEAKPINEAGGTRNSASTTLQLPAGATVKYALLEWSANRSDGTDKDPADTLDGDMNSARLRVPDAPGMPGTSTYMPVTADSFTQRHHRPCCPIR
jgi:hypothetical protein